MVFGIRAGVSWALGYIYVYRARYRTALLMSSLGQNEVIFVFPLFLIQRNLLKRKAASETVHLRNTMSRIHNTHAIV
uniref:hypothetical protein n=1 Tax=Candidatus Electrothrix sp. TaxID=2170559 RepID=UPI0040567151